MFGSLRQYQDGETERRLQEMKVEKFLGRNTKRKKNDKKVVQTTSIQ